jgi:hypothetical protein
MPLQDLMIFALLLVAGLTVVKPLAGALAERIRRSPDLPADGHQELVDEVRAMRHELAELAERVDFAERLLAKGSEADRVNARGS